MQLGRGLRDTAEAGNRMKCMQFPQRHDSLKAPHAVDIKKTLDRCQKNQFQSNGTMT
jgi:hypothetical protein